MVILKKRYIILLSILVIIFIFIGSFVYNEIFVKRNPLISYTVNGDVLTVSGKGKIPDYAHCSECSGIFEPLAPWENDVYYVDEIIVEEGITGIGDHAFDCCAGVEKIKLPNSIKSIGCFAFDSELTSFYISENVQSIDYRAFWKMQLQEIAVDPNNKYFCSIDGVLFNKSATKLIYYPKNKSGKEYSIPKSVKVIGESAFSDSNKLLKIDIHNKVVSIGERAFDCYQLKEINYEGTIPQWKKFKNVIDEEFDSVNVICLGG